MFFILYYFLWFLTVICDSARILVVIPTPSISHQVVFRPLTVELAKRGHEVVVITTDPIYAKGKAPANYTEIDVHDISYAIWQKFVDTSSSKYDLAIQLKVAFKQIHTIVENQLKAKNVQDLLNDKEQEFDLLVIESWAMLALAFTHIWKVPTILLSSFGPHLGVCEMFGAPNHPALYPLPIRTRVRNMSFMDKIVEFYGYLSYDNIFAESLSSGNLILKQLFGPGFPTLNELMKNVDMIFLNNHPVWDFNRPVPPNVIYLGGLHQNPPRQLPQELQSYLDSSANGVIYMSLGTNVKPSFLPPNTIKVFLKVFAALPYNVLFKWDQDELEGRSNNVNISKWFPQADLLRHPNVKLFITQGGLQSTDESITAGVPLIGIPILGDQWYNAELYVHYKIGVKLDIDNLTEEDLMNAINTVLKDDSYRANIVKLGTLMKDQPESPLERAIWWTEYVLRHGGAKHLRSPAANITWTEYLELEVVAIVLGSMLASILIFVFVIKISLKFVLSSLKFKND